MIPDLREAMLAELLPKSVRFAEEFDDDVDTWLFPEEEAVIRNAVEKRRQEFTVVRHCARQALGSLGRSAVAILPGQRGAPQWPNGVVGSMTHCSGYRAAAVAAAEEIRAIGIDAEPNDPVPADVRKIIANPAELRDLRVLESAPGHVSWDRLLFSAKESVFKAWFPATKRWLNFSDCIVEIDRSTATFRAQILVASSYHELRLLRGKWLSRGGLLVTAVTTDKLT